MSGEPPPHHLHRGAIPHWPFTVRAISNLYPVQPQHAHMSSEHSMIRQPLWHPAAGETLKPLAHSHASHPFSIHQRFENQIPPARPAPGVDLSLASHNGEAPTTPISLSVRDTKRINYILQKNAESGRRSSEPCEPSPVVGPAALHMENNRTTAKRSKPPLDSVLERLKPNLLRSKSVPEKQDDSDTPVIIPTQTVIVQSNNSHDENSNSSSILNVSTTSNNKDDDVASPYSNEDSLDSNKSRRKRKPSKTVRCPKENEAEHEPMVEVFIETNVLPPVVENPVEVCSVTEDKRKNHEPETKNTVEICLIQDKGKEDVKEINNKSIPNNPVEFCIIPEVKVESNSKDKEKGVTEVPTIEINDSRSDDDVEIVKEIKTPNGNVESKPIIIEDPVPVPASIKSRRETSLESETIDNIAAMVQEGMKSKTQIPPTETKEAVSAVSVIKTKECLQRPKTSSPIIITPAQRKEPHFVEVEDKLEAMFAGIDEEKSSEFVSHEIENAKKANVKKQKRPASRRNSDVVSDSGKKTVKKLKTSDKKRAKSKKKTTNLKQLKPEVVKDNLDSSNSSFTRSRGPFIHIKGPRDSPISVNVVNTPTNEDEVEKKKTKKYHDDSEYRHKVRSKGLHCSTLSNKYDAQTKDVSWICVFCKRGPHTSEINGVALTETSFPSGDLFGPYFITTDCVEFVRRLEDPFDKQFKSKKIARALDANNVSKPIGKKFKRKHSDSISLGEQSDPYVGITETENNKNYEIWAHEECIVWSPGVHLVGPKIVGLEEAVWTACNVVCARCNLKGANICCLRRGCTRVMHLWCAKSSGWQLDEDSYRSLCPEHRIQ